MKKQFLTLIAIIFATVFLNSCSDNSSSPTTTDNYFPLKVGNQWTYKVEDTDENYKNPTSSSTQIDLVKGSLAINGKNGFLVTSTYEDNSIDSVYQYSTASSLFQYGITTALLSDFEQVIPKWDEMLNITKSLTLISIDSNIILEGIPAKLKFIITTKPLTTKGSFTINGKTYETKDFEFIMSSTLTSSVVPQMNMSIILTNKLSFVNNIGLVKVLRKEYMNIPNQGESTSYGTQTLTSYNF